LEDHYESERRALKHLGRDFQTFEKDLGPDSDLQTRIVDEEENEVERRSHATGSAPDMVGEKT